LNKFIKFVSVIIILIILGFINLQDKSYQSEITDDITADQLQGASERITEPMVDFVEYGTMKASWYGPRFDGKLTANGEIYDQMGLTAAHKTLPFGTILKITNPKNGNTVIIRINDRGPYIDGRDLDLSRGAAQALDMIYRGVARVNVEQVVIKDTGSPITELN